MNDQVSCLIGGPRITINGIREAAQRDAGAVYFLKTTKTLWLFVVNDRKSDMATVGRPTTLHSRFVFQQ